jgi:hypothetical protein
MAVNDWQEIETAPRDGTHILGYVLDGTEHHIYEVIHDHHGSWYESGEEYRFRPTHWMPLPEPPEANGGLD